MPYYNVAGSAPVQSVNGKIDDVVLNANDVSAVAAQNGVASGIRLDQSKFRKAPDQLNVSGNVVLDYALGDWFKIQPSGTITISLANMPNDGVAAVFVEGINMGAQTVNWPAGSNYPGGTAPALTASGRDVIAILKNPNGVDVFTRSDLKSS